MKPQGQKRKKVSSNLAQQVGTSSKIASKTDCMSNSVVLRTVFSKLTASDLINCRLVNKLWYSEANSALRRPNIALKISSDDLLNQVEQLTDLIPRMSLPFNGLSVRKFPLPVACPGNREDSGRDSLDEFLRVLPPLKHLLFDDSSASEELVLRLLEANTDNLEILSFQDAGANLPDEILRAIFDLDKLTKIQGTTYPDKNTDKENLCEIIERSKSLESVEGIIFSNFYGVYSRLHVIKQFHLFVQVDRFNQSVFEEYLQKVPANRRFTSLRLDSFNISRQTKQLILNLAHSCKVSLTSLEVDVETVGIPSVLELCGECCKLRSLSIDGVAESSLLIESDLLGIFMEELLLLRDMNLTVGQLSKLQIVPVRPALHHLTGLVYLSIQVLSEEAMTRYGKGEYLLDWQSKRDGIDYRRRRDASKILKALSLAKIRSSWKQE